MAFEINKFRTHFSNNGEFAKADKFEAKIYVPSALTEDARDSRKWTEALSLQCEIAELPGRTLATIDQRHYAFTNKIPFFNVYSEITLTFYCTGNMNERRFFENWMNLAVPSYNGLINYESVADYKRPIQIVQYGQSAAGSRTENRSGKLFDAADFVNAVFPNSSLDDRLRTLGQAVDVFGRDDKVKNRPNEVFTLTLDDAIPVGIAPLSTSWQDDSIHRLAVTFAYKKYRMGITSEGSSLAESNPLDKAPTLPDGGVRYNSSAVSRPPIAASIEAPQPAPAIDNIRANKATIPFLPLGPK